MSEVTRLLDAVTAGNRAAAGDLLPLVYDELRKLASSWMANEPAGHTLQPTALVHEAFLRLVGSDDAIQWGSRGHFFAAAAEAMRRILIDSARRKTRLRHGGDRIRVDLPADVAGTPDPEQELLAVNEVVDQLAEHDPVAADLVKMHVFAGLPLEDVAKALGISVRTGYRNWAYARAWMYRKLEDSKPA